MGQSMSVVFSKSLFIIRLLLILLIGIAVSSKLYANNNAVLTDKDRNLYAFDRLLALYESSFFTAANISEWAYVGMISRREADKRLQRTRALTQRRMDTNELIKQKAADLQVQVATGQRTEATAAAELIAFKEKIKGLRDRDAAGFAAFMQSEGSALLMTRWQDQVAADNGFRQQQEFRLKRRLTERLMAVKKSVSTAVEEASIEQDKAKQQLAQSIQRVQRDIQSKQVFWQSLFTIRSDLEQSSIDLVAAKAKAKQLFSQRERQYLLTRLPQIRQRLESQVKARLLNANQLEVRFQQIKQALAEGQ